MTFFIEEIVQKNIFIKNIIGKKFIDTKEKIQLKNNKEFICQGNNNVNCEGNE